jgi:hypothetical protein
VREEIFLLGIIMVIIGPIIVALSFSSCLGTILSGNVFACVSDIGYVVAGGAFFVAGIITATVGFFVPDRAPLAPAGAWSTPVALATPPGSQIPCKKCGRVYDSGQFFCPSCGQRRT